MTFVNLSAVGEMKQDSACPTNGKIGRPIDTITLKALVNLSLTEIRDTKYRFCPDPQCPTVYYSLDGLQTLTETDLRERVYQKHPLDADVFVCYCFRHTVGNVLSNPSVLGKGAVIEEINQGIKNGQCACDIRNPQGSCCLGNVNKLVKNIPSE